MKHMLLIASSMALLGLASTARAQRAAGTLQYTADERCPDEGRFRDEISARIGYQPFTGEGATEVRLVPSGEEFLGTLQLGELSRVVPAPTCEEAFNGLVEALAVHLDTEPVTPTPRPAPSARESNEVQLHAVGDEGTRLFRINARSTGFGTASNGASVSVSAVQYSPMCTLPCTLSLTRGAYEIGAAPAGRNTPTRSFDVDILEDSELELHMSDRQTIRTIGTVALYGVTGVGVALLTAAILGVGETTTVDDAGFEETSMNKALLYSGIGIAAVGLTVGFVLRFQQDRIEWEIQPSAPR